jgi:hypothetical protein
MRAPATPHWEPEKTMTLSIVRRISLALALVLGLALPGAALAGRAKVDGRTARAAVIKNRAARGQSTAISVTKIRNSKSGKSSQVLATVLASGRVQAYNVNKKTKVARRTPTGLVSQGKAARTASAALRRERAGFKTIGKISFAGGQRSSIKRFQPRGGFAGVDRQGVTRGGSYRFASATDKTEKVFVSPISGKIVASRK